MEGEVQVVKRHKPRVSKGNIKATLKKMKEQKQLLAMSVPFVIYILIFYYWPLTGWVMAFQNFRPAKGLLDQEWVGLQQFKTLFFDNDFIRVIRNTLCMSVINLVFGFVTSILLALLINEIHRTGFKKIVQTISYLPHFLSWVVVSSLVINVLAAEDGLLNNILIWAKVIKEPVLWLGVPKYFWWIIGAANVWKEVGWNSIIYLAAMSGIDPALYEAAEIDGANRFQRMRYVTLPCIKPTIIILLIMNIGWILNAGFEVQFLLGKGLVMDVSETIDIFTLKYGIAIGNYSLATAAGMFKSVVSILLIGICNGIAKKTGDERLI